MGITTAGILTQCALLTAADTNRLTLRLRRRMPEKPDMDDVEARMQHMNQFRMDTSKMDVKWEDIVGLEQLKESLQVGIILPMKKPDLYKGRPMSKGILLT